MSETERIRRIYDERAATYDRGIGVTERLLLGPFRREFGARLRGETLEIGIGSGLNLPHYTDAVISAAGIDLSSAMLEIAARRAADFGLTIALSQADAEHLPFADASFDTVAISLALCTVPHPETALQEMTRVCRPDGRIVLLEHVLSPSPLVATAECLLSPLQERVMGCHLDRDTIGLIRSLGFTINEDQQRFFGVFRLVVARPPCVPS